MNLETYMLRRVLAICAKAEASNLNITKDVLSMVYAEITEVVNDVRAKIKGAIDVLPPMPNISVIYKDGRIRATIDTCTWNEVPPEDERSEWDVDEEDED